MYLTFLEYPRIKCEAESILSTNAKVSPSPLPYFGLYSYFSKKPVAGLTYAGGRL